MSFIPGTAHLYAQVLWLVILRVSHGRLLLVQKQIDEQGKCERARQYHAATIWFGHAGEATETTAADFIEIGGTAEGRGLCLRPADFGDCPDAVRPDDWDGKTADAIVAAHGGIPEPRDGYGRIPGHGGPDVTAEEIAAACEEADRRIMAVEVPLHAILEETRHHVPVPRKGGFVAGSDWARIFSDLPAWAPPAYELTGFDYTADAIARILAEGGTAALLATLDEETEEEIREDDMDDEI